MDLTTVTDWRTPRGETDLELATGEAFLAGGTWLFSEPQEHLRGLVDLTALGWPDVEPLPDGGLRIAATCTIATLQRAPWPPATADVVRSCADALLMSPKVQESATVGGNICLGLPAGAMISLFAGLGASAVIRTGPGLAAERTEPVASLVSGPGRTRLATGELLRAVEVPASALRAPVAFARTSLTERGRSAAVVVGRRDPDAVVLTLTASTPRPVLLRLPVQGGEAAITPAALTEALRAVAWYDDQHGAADWRAAMTGLLVERVVADLAAQHSGPRR
ncbi:MAG: FAD binding domain-containing protein [Nocardioides sp.]|uniref:FAD binding domain-containing protein n=1 Tax=Nocardioides sp. TaxID=35761 RepID=UPI0039E51FED